MRVPYVADSITPEDASEEAIVERVRQRRLPGPLLDLDRALLHCPPVADGWNSLFGSIRSRTTLSTDIRELAICRVAVLTKSQYEWSQHAPLAAEAGVNMTALKGSGEGLTGNQLAVLHYTDSMTQDVFVSDDMFQELGRFFGDREIVEITATIAIYNCCSRFLVALDVGERNEQIQVEKW